MNEPFEIPGPFAGLGVAGPGEATFEIQTKFGSQAVTQDELAKLARLEAADALGAEFDVLESGFKLAPEQQKAGRYAFVHARLDAMTLNVERALKRGEREAASDNLRRLRG